MDARVKLVRSVFAPGSAALAAFDYLLAHAGAAAFKFVPYESAVRSVELQWPDRQRNPFSAQAHADYINFYLRRPILNEHPELFAAGDCASIPGLPYPKSGVYAVRQGPLLAANLRRVFARQPLAAFLRGAFATETGRLENLSLPRRL